MPSRPLQCEQAVLIVADDPAFIAGMIERWGKNAESPELRVVGSSACASCRPEEFQCVLIGGLHPKVCAEVLATFRPGNTPLIVVGITDGMLASTERNSPKVLLLPEFPGWQDLLLATAKEVKRRSDAQAHAQRSDRASAALQCHAVLGRYIIDMRHNLNNALTSVLGNAELLLLGDATFTATERNQIDTIRRMALRMHETLQRLSALERELRSSGGESADCEVEVPMLDTDLDLKHASRLTEECRRQQFVSAAGAD